MPYDSGHKAQKAMRKVDSLNLEKEHLDSHVEKSAGSNSSATMRNARTLCGYFLPLNIESTPKAPPIMTRNPSDPARVHIAPTKE